MNLEKTIKNLRMATLLSLLFCTVLAWVISEQGRTIQGQRELIRVLFQDSEELNHRKLEEVLQENMRKKLPKSVQQDSVPKDALPGCVPNAICG